METGLNPETYHRERHTGNLTKPTERDEFVRRVATAMETASKALLDTAKRLRTDPDAMLAHAFVPNITGMLPTTTAVLEISMHAESRVKAPFLNIIGKTIVDGSKINEVGIRARWRNGMVEPTEDLHRF